MLADTKRIVDTLGTVVFKEHLTELTAARKALLQKWPVELKKDEVKEIIKFLGEHLHIHFTEKMVDKISMSSPALSRLIRAEGFTDKVKDYLIDRTSILVLNCQYPRMMQTTMGEIKMAAYHDALREAVTVLRPLLDT